jgi:putative phosphoribosyl transferase
MSDFLHAKIPPVGLSAEVGIPRPSRGLVLFAHGSGSSRSSPRNRAVAAALQDAGYATVLFDLLTEDEAALHANVFEIELLASRLVQAIDWVRLEPSLRGLPLGLFGASTGAAAAICAAAQRPRIVRAVVSRGGRPDLAGAALGQITAPTLLIVGGEDHVVITLNHEATKQMIAPTQLVVVPGATHLFEEQGALEQVTRLARDWFDEHVAA